MIYYAPEMMKKAFTCPHCNAYANMRWAHVGSGMETLFLSAKCAHCHQYSYWFNEACEELQGKMFYPATSNIPMPHQDMPESVKKDYLEARSVLPHSTRAAAALLRLALQRLCVELGKSDNINRAIGELVADGLPREVQMALDTVRIVGNESVHPGQINDEDLDKHVSRVFDLMNFIVQDRIARIKEIQDIYQSLPQGKREAVEERDNWKANDNS